MESIGIRLKQFRKTQKKTQEEIAATIGLGSKAWSALEKDYREPTEQTLLLLSVKFNLNIDWLKTGNGKMYLQESPIEKIQKPDSTFDDIIDVFKMFSPETQDDILKVMKKIRQDIIASRLRETTIRYKDPASRKIDESIEQRVADYRELLYQTKGKNDDELTLEEKKKLVDFELEATEKKEMFSRSIVGNFHVADSKME